MSEYTGIDFHSDHVEAFAAQYQHSAPFRERFDVWSALIARYADPAGTAIDVGCGVGTFTREAARHARSVLGIDASDKMILAARRQAPENASFRHATIEALGHDPPAPAALVLCSSVLEYVEDLGGSLDVLAGLVAPGGHLIVSMPNPASLYRRAERVAFALVRRPAYYGFVRHVISLSQLVADLAPRGLQAVESRTYGRGSGRFGGMLYVAVLVQRGQPARRPTDDAA